MKRNLMLAYGIVNYLLFLSVYLYLAGFLLNFGVPKSIDSGVTDSLAASALVNSILVTLFGLQHSVMARPSFKRLWTRLIPKPIERSTYVLLSNLVLMLLFWQWRPMPQLIWNANIPALQYGMYALFFAGLLIVPAVTFLISHFDLFGLKQVWLNLKGHQYSGAKFVTPGPYKIVRHPLYVGWLIVFWATPTLTVGHALFASLMTIYILIAITFEERNLAGEFGKRYEEYRSRTPMLIPARRSAAIAETTLHTGVPI